MRLRFRAAAADHAKVDISDDPSGGVTEWGQRGSRTFAAPTTKVSTVGVNAVDSELKAELFGEVKISFASETVPLDRFVDDARRTILERHARSGPGAGAFTANAAASGAAAAPAIDASPPPAAPAAGGTR